MLDGAIFQSKAEADLWKNLVKADSITNPQNRISALSDVLNSILKDSDFNRKYKPVRKNSDESSEQVPDDIRHDSRTLCRMIEIIAETGADGWTEDIRDIVAKRRPRDCHPAYTAALCLIEKGLLTDAESYVDMIGEAPDKAMYNYVKAKVALERQDTTEAANYLTFALNSNRLYHDVYVLLAQIRPEINWVAYEACERMACGLEYDEPADDGSPEYGLYSIYREWYSGNHESATRMLISSQGYIEKVPPYCILSARMSRDEKDLHSCQMMLEEANKVLECDVYLQCEIGNAYLEDGSADIALARFRDAEAFDIANPYVVRGMINSCMALGKNSEALQNIREFLSSELVTYDDFVRYSKVLMDLGFNEDAQEAAAKILYSNPSDPCGCVIVSRVALNDGDFRNAESFAKTAVSKNKKNADALAQLARVYLALRRFRKAESTARKAVSADKSSVLALMTLLEIYRETGENDNAASVCRSILEIDPHNSQAEDILASINLAQALKDTNAEEMIPNVVGADDFIRLISTLVAEGKYPEAEKLCKDNDHRFGSVAEVRRLRGNAEYALGEYLKASASFASAAVLMKGDAEIWHSKGLADEKFGDLDSAEEAFGKAILLDMYNPKYWISNGIVKEKKGDLNAAVKAFNRAIELDPRSPYALVRKAAIFASCGMYSESLNFLELAEASEPNSVLVMAVKMKVCLKASRYTEAALLGRKLMKKDPESDVVAVYARANMGIQDFGTARKVLEKALSQDPESLDLLFAYRDLAVMQADNAEIIEICNKILEIVSNDKSTKKALADALIREGRSDEANILYSAIRNEVEEVKVTEESEDPVALFNIAKSMLDAGDLISAARLTDRAMAVDPDNIEYALLRASIYRRSGDRRVADMFLSQYLERNPTNASVHEAIGDMRAEDGDYEGASESYGKALQSGIKKTSIYIKLGNVQEKLGATKPAMNSYSTAVMLDPNDAEATRCLASMQLKAKDYESALRSINASIASSPSGDAYAILAMVYQGLKDRAGVRDAYQGFLRYENVGDQAVSDVITALNSVGLRTEATMLKSRTGSSAEDAPEDDTPPEIKRCSERIMRRAYMMGAEVNDPGISDGVNSDENTVKNALLYLADIPSYGEVIYGTNECDHLEQLSYNIMQRGKSKDLELVTVESAYVAGGAKDVDEAKLLLAYVRSARTSRMPREIPEEFVKLGAETNEMKSVEEVMLDYKVGVYAARMILASARSKSEKEE